MPFFVVYIFYNKKKAPARSVLAASQDNQVNGRQSLNRRLFTFSLVIHIMTNIMTNRKVLMYF